MHCTTMLIISNIIPMHCLYISIALQNFTYHKQCIPMQCTTMLIMNNIIPMHCLCMSIASHNYAYHKQCILSIAQLCLSSAISFQCIVYILLLHCTTMLIIRIQFLCIADLIQLCLSEAISFQCIAYNILIISN